METSDKAFFVGWCKHAAAKNEAGTSSCHRNSFFITMSNAPEKHHPTHEFLAYRKGLLFVVAAKRNGGGSCMRSFGSALLLYLAATLFSSPVGAQVETTPIP